MSIGSGKITKRIIFCQGAPNHEQQVFRVAVVCVLTVWPLHVAQYLPDNILRALNQVWHWHVVHQFGKVCMAAHNGSWGMWVRWVRTAMSHKPCIRTSNERIYSQSDIGVILQLRMLWVRMPDQDGLIFNHSFQTDCSLLLLVWLLSCSKWT